MSTQKQKDELKQKATKAKHKSQRAAQKVGNAFTRTVKDPKTWAFVSGLATGVASVVGWQYYDKS